MTEKHMHNRIVSAYACVHVHNTMHYADIAHMMDVSYMYICIVLQQCGTVYVVFAQAHPNNYPACMHKG